MSHSTSHGEKVRFLPASLASPRRSSGPRTAGRWMGRRRLVYEIILYLDKALKGRRQLKKFSSICPGGYQPLFFARLCSYFSCCCRKIAFFSNSCEIMVYVFAIA